MLSLQIPLPASPMSAELLVVAGHALTPLGLLSLGAAVLAAAVGLHPLLRDELLRESLFFLLFCLAVAVWLTGFGWAYGAPDEARALRWFRFAYLGVPLIPVALYTVAVHSLEVADERRLALATLWVAATVFVLLIGATDLILAGLYEHSWGWYPRYTPAGSAFVAFVLAGLGASLAEYGLRLRGANRKRERVRARRFLLAFGIGSLAVVDFLPAFGAPVYPIGAVVVPIMLLSIDHTIRNYHLAELTPGFAADHILATMNEPVLVVDREGEVRVTNVAATSILGYSRDELVGRPLASLGRGGVADTDPWVGMLSGAVVRSRNLVLRSRDGEPVEASVSAAPVTDRRGRRVGTAVVIRDQRERTALRRQAFHDPLTGLPNRALYRDRLAQLLRMQTRRPDRGLAVMYLDVDDFKRINDRLGHGVGDEVLTAVAERLRSITRAGDTAARLGGDEFAVVLGDLDADTAREEARTVAERTRQAFTDPVQAGERILDVAVSIGVAVLTGGPVEPEELTARADRAMYRAKAAPGNAIVIHQPEDGEEEERPGRPAGDRPAAGREEGTT